MKIKPCRRQYLNNVKKNRDLNITRIERQQFKLFERLNRICDSRKIKWIWIAIVEREKKMKTDKT